MKHSSLLTLLAMLLGLALVLPGCGGQRIRTSTITGTVVNIDFEPMRDFSVRAGGVTTKTTNTGSFTLTEMPEGEVLVIAEERINGVTYRGRTSILNFPNEQQNSVNIVVAPVSQLATVRGIVRDRSGFALKGASVFAYNGAGGSARAFTNSDGNYVLADLIAGVNYSISATGQGYESDQTSVNLSAGETRTLNLVLDDPFIPVLNPPQNVGATSWVSHPTSRSTDQSAVKWVKDNFDPKPREFRATSRAIRSDMSVEVELFWDQQQFSNLFGYGIYRANSASGPLNGIDFYFDPLAPYYVDIGLNPFSTYSYALTTIATLYPDYPNQTESNFSSRVVVDTLNLLNLGNVLPGPTFTWFGGSGAQTYHVFVFDRFPTDGVSSLWSGNTNGFSLAYGGGPLQPGRTYYYLVLGVANSNSSRTISRVGTFVP
ncbi:carboxypeptidase-like regulatory domain-containing protein [Kamptonema cortianum]|nr:carboxypeptidase-like regulatory domain-containing protein [Geitlerinema splendidum]MDK3156979.1 carboxypeptidase-like regulatory domain-containing protein [Kamptonema cortianum]